MNKLTLAPALGYAAIGVSSLLRPASVPEMFGGTAPTPESRTGFWLGVEVALTAALVVAD